MPRTVYIETVGCQMNVLDSELVVAALHKAGYRIADQPADADLLLFNTCSVREHAEDKVYSALGRVAPLKKARPGTVVGVLGCMAQKDQDLIRKRAPFVDLVVGTGQLARVPELVEAVRATGQPQFALSLGRADAGKHAVEASFVSFDPARDSAARPTPFQAFVRVQFGCDKFCTYCVVPSTRGPEQSRPPDHILAEAKQLAGQGCKEITLIGQTVNSYEFDHGDGRRTRLSDVLAKLDAVPGLERVRFVTNFPKDMTDDLLTAVRDLPTVVKYLHVPAQSGCDDVLKRMKRLYTAGEYRDMLARCRELVPGVSVSSDFIVGFCGETEASFAKSMELVREARFKNSFIFKYSERPGTKAAERYPDDVPEDVKKRRNNDLLMVQNANSLADHRAQIGTTVEVLVEGPSKRSARTDAGGEVLQLTGRSMADHIVVFDGPTRLVGNTVRVRVDDASAFTLYGRVQTGEGVGAVVAFTPDAARAAADGEDAPAYPAPLDFAPPAEKRIGLPLA
ncbi:tRNA (N6-isopentenyl adenosine(37)-C2)-methylthiotransferase MiaB [Urbifossiella limnaea]|uniref:tRNA-2-methylthio-N(6)-dimethylallyladenosine synthase n=1 Tax=Urbifossiella limnaea TaxID=2528023 RepID=A0A517XYH9_9BACT|nr:tRNA (N6-isopentenyl adenosine(37)-C2)-methylthiotransferase MiaB [Urbifossiella limnaea]QDU22528.1 tRNA-2-methylthio-N(6)-dimethylallyladenosine synthase [Urbifossiella limnaea]